MKHILRYLLIFSAFLVFFSASSKIARASEGTIEMRSSTREAYRCYASSVLMQDQNYTILVSCRELIYPAGNEVFSYVLWAQPADGSAPRRLGELGYGRLQARMNVPFTSLFVSTEANPGVGKPTGPIVMRGDVTPIRFLDRATTPTPTSINASGDTSSSDTSTTLTPTPGGQSTTSKIGTAFKRAGLAALLALLALIGLVFAITRARG